MVAARVEQRVTEAKRPLQVVLAVRPPLFAELLTERLAREPDLEVAETLADPADLPRALRRAHPDVIFLDPRFAPTSVADFARRVHSVVKSVRLVVLASPTSNLHIMDAIRAGCSAFASTELVSDDLVEALRDAGSGHAHMDESLLTRFHDHIHAPTPRSATLSDRETEALSLMSEGCSARVMAERMDISVNTARHHAQSVLTKLGVHSKLEAVATAVQQGLIPPHR